MDVLQDGAVDALDADDVVAPRSPERFRTVGECDEAHSWMSTDEAVAD